MVLKTTAITYDDPTVRATVQVWGANRLAVQAVPAPITVTLGRALAGKRSLSCVAQDRLADFVLEFLVPSMTFHDLP